LHAVFAHVSKAICRHDSTQTKLRPSYAAFFLCAQRAFIIADNFFRMAALIGFRAVDFFEAGLAALGAGLPFCFAHQAFFAAPILARAAALICPRFWLPAGLAWLPLGGRPRRVAWEPDPISAAIAFSIRLTSCLSCATMLVMSMPTPSSLILDINSRSPIVTGRLSIRLAG
jgi:hypothetical protein